MAAKEYLDGAHEGHTVLYKYDHYPNHAIGPVMFLWQYHLRGDDEDMVSIAKVISPPATENGLIVCTLFLKRIIPLPV